MLAAVWFGLMATGTPRPVEAASPAFWDHWGDGRAELSGYSIRLERYGAERQGTVVLVYVTEDLNRTTLVKNDRGSLAAPDKLPVLKLNAMLNFRTGIYPYSVMTSVFASIDASGGAERFAPVKLTFTAQEWCGQVFRSVKPESGHFTEKLHSYFEVEGDATRQVDVDATTLYEDALWIQLRELDGPFAGGGDWQGLLVPSLWRVRQSHEPLAPVEARITRDHTTVDGVPVARFVVAAPDFERVFDVEEAPPRRILAWRTSGGEKATLLGTKRFKYWQLNGLGDEALLSEFGLGSSEH